MPVTTIDLRGLRVIEDPLNPGQFKPNPTGDGGDLVQDNFVEIALRSGPVFEAATDPTVNDDSADTAGNGKFYIWSLWRNTVTNDLFMLADATPTGAAWQNITSGGAGTIIVEEDDSSVVAAATTLNFTTGIDVTDAGGGQATVAVDPGEVDHDALLNFVANKHLDHTLITLTAGAGLTGGGDITVNRSFAVDIPGLDAATVAGGDLLMIADINDSNNLKKVTAQTIADLAPSGSISIEEDNSEIVASAMTINFSTGLDVTDAGGNQADVIVDPGEVDHDSLLNYDANDHVDHTNVTITTGAGLSGGGDISTNRTFDVDITNETDNDIAAGDEILFADATDSFNIKKDTVQGILDLVAADTDTHIDVEEDDTPVLTNITTLNLSTGLDGSDAGGGQVTVVVDPGEVDHDSLLNYDANDHVDHTGVTLTAGVAMLGGGDITTDRTFDVDVTSAPSGAVVAADDEFLLADTDDSGATKKDTVQGILDLVPGASIEVEEDDSAVVAAATTLNFTTGIDVADAGSGQADIAVDPGEVDHDALLNYDANDHIDHTGVTLTAGVAMLGGGDITTDRTFDVDVTSAPAGAVAADDELLFADTDDSDATKKDTVQAIVDLAVAGTVDPLILTEISEPGTPDADTLQLYAFDQNGITVLDYKTADNDVVRLARDMFLIVRNTSGSPITEGQLVYITGSTGEAPTVSLALADSSATLPSVGFVVDASIAHNGYGRVQTGGKLDKVAVPTATFADGEVLWLSASAAGEFVNVEPVYPNKSQRLGVVITAHNSNGVIHVEIDAVYHNHDDRTDNPHAVTATQVGAIASIDGVSNDGGDVDLVEGAGISITPNDGADTITFDVAINPETGATIAADDEILFSDTDDLNSIKKDTVQGILDLVHDVFTLEVEEDDVSVLATADILNFGHALAVTDAGGNQADVVVDETELDIFNFLFPGNALLDGGATWDSGLTYQVSDLTYVIDKVIYDADGAPVTLDAADATNPRIDVIYVDAAGVIGKITGTPAANPVKPALAADQVEVTFATLQALATTPDVTVTDVYMENIEWTTSGPGEYDFAATTDPYSGTTHIQATAAAQGDQMTFTAGADLDMTNVTNLELHIKPQTWTSDKVLRFELEYNGIRIGDRVTMATGDFGFDKDDSSAYQTISIPKSAFNVSSELVDALIIEPRGGGANITFRLDQIRFQEGVPVGVPQPVFTNIVADSGSTTADSSTDTLKILGDTATGGVISTAIAAGTDTVQISGLKHNLTAVVAPDQDNDNTEGYEIGSVWVDTVGKDIYMAVSVGTGTAEWKKINVPTIPASLLIKVGIRHFEDVESVNWHVQFDLDDLDQLAFATPILSKDTSSAQTNWSYVLVGHGQDGNVVAFPGGGVPTLLSKALGENERRVATARYFLTAGELATLEKGKTYLVRYRTSPDGGGTWSDYVADEIIAH
jgi:hypothetical protein